MTVPTDANLEPRTQPEFRLHRAIKLGTFHVGSSIGDLLTSAVWNRVMIVDLGITAWPVAMLTALRYLLAPLTLWAGHRSDTRPIFGSRRIAYIWLGRLLMLISLPLLPLSTVAIAESASSPTGWGLAIVSFLLYGMGTLISGPPFMALVHDSAPYERRGQAISVVQFMLVVSFAFIPTIYARLMPSYEPELYTQLVFVSIAGAAAFWFFSILGEERRGAVPATLEQAPAFIKTFSTIWADVRTKRYALFLGASAFFAFMQDAVLEPFGGDVFHLAAGETTRFNAYWGAGVLVGMVGTILLTRRWSPEKQVITTAWGLALLGLGLSMLGLTSLLEVLGWVMPVLAFFGLGFGIFTVGGVSLLMAMSKEEHAGSYLALWSVVQLVSRGAGIGMGGVLRDFALLLTKEFAGSYAIVFGLEALGIFTCVLLLRRVDVVGFAADRCRTEPTETLTAGAR